MNGGELEAVIEIKKPSGDKEIIQSCPWVCIGDHKNRNVILRLRSKPTFILLSTVLKSWPGFGKEEIKSSIRLAEVKTIPPTHNSLES